MTYEDLVAAVASVDPGRLWVMERAPEPPLPYGPDYWPEVPRD